MSEGGYLKIEETIRRGGRGCLSGWIPVGRVKLLRMTIQSIHSGKVKVEEDHPCDRPRLLA